MSCSALSSDNALAKCALRHYNRFVAHEPHKDEDVVSFFILFVERLAHFALSGTQPSIKPVERWPSSFVHIYGSIADAFSIVTCCHSTRLSCHATAC